MRTLSMVSLGFVALLWTVCGVNSQNCRDDIEEIREMLAMQQARMEQLETENKRLTLENKRFADQTNRLERGLPLPQTNGSITPVAFYAFMSKEEAAPSAHFTLKFDVVKTNVGNGYNSHSGTFMAPVAGTYVFTYTVYAHGRGAIFLNILVNEEVFGGSVSDTQENGDYDSETTTIVANLKQGDSVNIRTSRASTTSILSARDLHTTFAGWRIF